MKIKLSSSGVLFVLGIAFASFGAMSSSTAHAAIYTWTGTSASTGNWFASGSSLVAPNWSGTTASLSSGDSLVYPSGSASTRTTGTQNGTATLANITFTGTTAYTIVGVTSGLTITGSVTNNSSQKQSFTGVGSSITFANNSVINTGSAGIDISRPVSIGANVSKVGSGTLTIGTLNNSASTLTGSAGTIVLAAPTYSDSSIQLRAFNSTISSTASSISFGRVVSGSGGNIDFSSSSLQVTGSTFVASTGTLSVGDNSSFASIVSQTNSVVNIGGLTNFNASSTIGGVLNLSTGTYGQQLITNNALTFGPNATLNMDFYGVDQGSAVTDNILQDNGGEALTYGGTLALNLANGVGDQLIETYTKWNLFSSNNAFVTSGSFSGVTLSATNPFYTELNNSPWTLAVSSTNYYDTKYGEGVWLSGWTTNNQRFVFNQNDGTLIVVPEPSTIVFASIGIVVLGWHTWTRRRKKAEMLLVEEHMRRSIRNRDTIGVV